MYDDAVSTSSMATSTTSTMSNATVHGAASYANTLANSADKAHMASATASPKNTSTNLPVNTASDVLFKLNDGASIEIDATGAIIIRAVDPVTMIANPNKSAATAVNFNTHLPHTPLPGVTTLCKAGVETAGGTSNGPFEAWADKVAHDSDALQSFLRTCRPNVDVTMHDAEAAENDLRAANAALAAKTTELQLKEAELQITSDKLRETKDKLDKANLKIAEYELRALESRHQVTKAQLEEATAKHEAAKDRFQLMQNKLEGQLQFASYHDYLRIQKPLQPQISKVCSEQDALLAAERNHQESQEQLEAAKRNLQTANAKLWTADEGSRTPEKNLLESSVAQRALNDDKISIAFNFADDQVTVETTKTATFGDLIQRLRAESDEYGGYRIPVTQMRFKCINFWFKHTATAEGRNLPDGASVFVYRRRGKDLLRRVEWV